MRCLLNLSPPLGLRTCSHSQLHFFLPCCLHPQKAITSDPGSCSTYPGSISPVHFLHCRQFDISKIPTWLYLQPFSGYHLLLAILTSLDLFLDIFLFQNMPMFIFEEMNIISLCLIVSLTCTLMRILGLNLYVISSRKTPHLLPASVKDSCQVLSRRGVFTPAFALFILLCQCLLTWFSNPPVRVPEDRGNLYAVHSSVNAEPGA